MPAGPGGLDANGVRLFGEADTEGLFSDLLNLGMDSVSAQFVVDRARMTGIEGDIAAAVADIDKTGSRRIVPTVGGTGVTVDATTGIITFTAASAVNVDGCFADDGSGMDEYELAVRKRGASTANQISVRLRASATDDSSSNYDHVFISTVNGAVTGGGSVGQTAWLPNGGTAVLERWRMRLSDVALALPTGFEVAPALSTPATATQAASALQIRQGHHRSATAFTGFSLFPNTGTITGVAWVRRLR